MFGKGVRNWLWCGMQAAHVLDSRKQTTSLKFRSLVRLGVSSYDEVSSKFMTSSGNERNKIAEVAMSDLLLYNGMDAVCTIDLAKIQMELMGR